MPTFEENLGWARSDVWEDHGEEWSSGFGDSRRMWFGFILPRLIDRLPVRSAVEIACGHGRCTRFLAAHVEHLMAVDIAAEIVDTCAQRLSDLDNISYHVNDGRTLPASDQSVDFVFSWDSLVHAEVDVLDAYVQEIARVLRPGGAAFLHHSNLGAYVDPTSREVSVEVTHWRGATMTAARLRDRAAQSGLHCPVQELIPWGGAELIDCFSTLVASPVGDRDTIVVEHTGFLDEAARLRRIADLYRPST
jgi:SAM-dependent methyltransferase